MNSRRVRRVPHIVRIARARERPKRQTLLTLLFLEPDELLAERIERLLRLAANLAGASPTAQRLRQDYQRALDLALAEQRRRAGEGAA